ncbi:MAG: alpha/beta fold hydrolase [Oscillospiraceae bacterium]|nr:alpha/beta fold hydrolase [Oscillospiraceae bacterium]
MTMKKLLKILKWTGIVLAGLIILVLLVRFIGKLYYSRTPDNGINETMYIDVNGQEQWINIYGEDKNNPVMLYLHGGPGGSTSPMDWVILRKLANDYTIVNWDQRNCGKTQIHDFQDKLITPELMRSDIDTVANYVLAYMGKEKLVILGHSWGTMYGGDYVIRHPEKADCIIDLSLSVDKDFNAMLNKCVEDYISGEIDYQTAIDKYGYLPFLYYNFLNESSCLDSSEKYKKYFEAVKQILTDWTANSEDDRILAEQFNPDELTKFMSSSSEDDVKKARHMFGESVLPLTDKYVYNNDENVSDSDVNEVAAVFFNPYYSIADYVKYAFPEEEAYSQLIDPTDEKSTECDVLLDDFDLSEKTEYAVPIYVLQGSDDDYCGIIKSYFDRINAPDKEFQYIDGGHMSTMCQSEKLAQFVHEIAEKQKNN